MFERTGAGCYARGMKRSLVCALPLALLACGEESLDPVTTTTTGSGGGSTTGTGGGGGMTPDPSVICAELGLAIEPRASGPFGTTRGELAENFELPLLGGQTFVFDERYSGCETYVFIPDTLTVSATDMTSVWEKDLSRLLDASPRNAHYFFFSRRASDEAASESLSAMAARIDAELAARSPEDAEHFRARLHVVAARAQSLEGWIGDALNGHGRVGMGIDRFQRIRGAGTLADVKRYSSALASQGHWPWRSNLAYVAHEATFFNAQFERLSNLEDRTVVTLFAGEELDEFADVNVTLPRGTEMAEFDTFEIAIEMACPDPTQPELGNCGAWDYLAHLFVMDGLGQPVELGRFITTYHRESQWIVDATPMLPHLLAGGARDFRWSFAPPWNPQPTKTKLSLLFSNQGKGIKPRAALPLFAGGDFNSSYNVGRADAAVAVPASAAKVELYALTTGHGAATGQCAEFCNHQHEFVVGGAVHLQQFEIAGVQDGCMAEVERGMTPNQGGTWWFGRGGWCPGQQVEPWRVDVTSDVTPGTDAIVSYRGLLNGAEPPDDAGNIVLASYLVIYE